MTCIFCQSGELTAYICSRCTQKVLSLSKEKATTLYDKAIAKGLDEQALFLGKLMGKGGQTNAKLKHGRKSSDRGRANGVSGHKLSDIKNFTVE